jgi:hypothetical protein
MSSVRLITFVFALQGAPAAAAVSCEQLADIAYATEQLRNQGHSLTTVLAEADKLESSGKFTRDELNLIKAVVDQAFKSIQSPLEVLQACREKSKR